MKIQTVTIVIGGRVTELSPMNPVEIEAHDEVVLEDGELVVRRWYLGWVIEQRAALLPAVKAEL